MDPADIHVAIVGSGPSGFYAAEALLDAPGRIHIDMFERLPTPYGLVRSGVAPDHPKLKKVSSVFARLMQADRYRFVGNTEVGRDVAVAALLKSYHAVVLAYGASGERQLCIPGEDLRGCHSATDFVGWYNGHPDFRDLSFDLSQEKAVVIGHGNVAADVCRILLQPADALASTDIAAHALEVLRSSRVREVHLVGRRGPAQAKFTSKELRGLGSIPGCSTSAETAVLGDACRQELADRRNVNAVKNVEALQSLVGQGAEGHRRLVLRFCLEPQSVEGEGRVARMAFRRTRLEGAPFEQRAVGTDERVAIECGLIFKSVGYRGSPLEGTPFDFSRGIVPSDRGRVTDAGEAVPGLYVTGWLKMGPTGIIGTNRADSIETVHRILEDLVQAPRATCRDRSGLWATIAQTGAGVVDARGWHLIDARERERGVKAGKPREKFVRLKDMLGCLQAPPQQGVAVGRLFAGTTKAFEAGTAADLPGGRR